MESRTGAERLGRTNPSMELGELGVPSNLSHSGILGHGGFVFWTW